MAEQEIADIFVSDDRHYIDNNGDLTVAGISDVLTTVFSNFKLKSRREKDNTKLHVLMTIVRVEDEQRSWGEFGIQLNEFDTALLGAMKIRIPECLTERPSYRLLCNTLLNGSLDTRLTYNDRAFLRKLRVSANRNEQALHRVYNKQNLRISNIV